MIDYQTWCRIKKLHKHDGLKISQIADELNMDQRTVVKWLKQDNFSPRKSSCHSSKLDPFKPDIVRLLESHPYTAVQIYQRLLEMGFDGSYSIVKRFVRKVRPRRAAAFLKLSFAPGECAQVDWGSYGTVKVGETRRRLSFFVIVLCYSRMMYVEFTVLQTMEHFLSCHQNAFAFFGGVPKKVMVDNLKSAVLHRFVGQEPVLNRKYLDFANHYGFLITPCNVGKGNEKGRVENGVGYVKKNFLSGLEIPDFASIHAPSRQWMENIANVRIHGETRQKPVVLFEEEKDSLHQLPPYLYDIATITQVRGSRQFRITSDTNRYSVPAEFAGECLTLKSYPDRLCIYKDEKLIARHIRSYDRYQDCEDPDHPKELLNQRRKARDQVIYRRFLALSDQAHAYYQELTKRRMNPAHHVRQIVALSEIYDPESVADAMADAFKFQAFSCEYIANILEQRTRFQAEPGTLHLTRRKDLLDIEVKKPDLSIYQKMTKEKQDDNQTS